ncbi:hypothetical protein FRB94_001009 [Tulasnella sp. JGI-2019a]|nr:hypothetical protein FRB93_008110 [Tulasnella sp. JGI-2019a]KAG8988190.1 hypothetical protein FRB94_001009 [Tulasnella sp. JGI-2019a]
MLKGLVSLKLKDLGGMSPNADQLIDILSASPGLETLYLDSTHVSTIEDPNTNITSRQVGFLELPVLKTLHIVNLPLWVERALISAIRLRERTLGFVAGLSSVGVTPGLFGDPSFKDLASFIRTSLASSEGLIVTCDDGLETRLELWTSTGYNIDLRIFGDWSSAPPSGLADALGELGSSQNRFCVRGSCPPQGIAPLLLSKCRFTTITLYQTD